MEQIITKTYQTNPPINLDELGGKIMEETTQPEIYIVAASIRYTGRDQIHEYIFHILDTTLRIGRTGTRHELRLVGRNQAIQKAVKFLEGIIEEGLIEE